MEIEILVDSKAVVEIIQHTPNMAWLRWYMPDFSDNGNIDLPVGKWEIKSRGNYQLTLIKTD